MACPSYTVLFFGPRVPEATHGGLFGFVGSLAWAQVAISPHLPDEEQLVQTRPVRVWEAVVRRCCYDPHADFFPQQRRYHSGLALFLQYAAHI